MDINQMFTSKYLKKEDFPAPQTCTIKAISSEDVSMENQPQELKPIMYFNEHAQGLVLNRTNANIVAAVYGNSTDGWVGQQILVKNDPSIQYQGKFVGGVRLEIPQHVQQQMVARSQQPQQQQQQAPQQQAPQQFTRQPVTDPNDPNFDPFPAAASDMGQEPPYR